MRRDMTMLVVLVVAMMVGSVEGLEVGFYRNTKCSSVEDVVRIEVATEFARNPSIVALLLRMYFHDCFADMKCDASLLIKRNKGLAGAAFQTELSAGANQGIRGLDFIDKLKQTVVTKACGGNADIVSCADIIALATRDGVALASRRGRYAVPTGRRDGTVSLAANGNSLPSPTSNISVIVGQFKLRKFSAEETVILSAAHTVGQARCRFFDPATAENATTAAALKESCRGGREARANLDQGPGSADVVDKSYFLMVQQGSGVLQSDRGLKTDAATSGVVTRLAGGTNDEFLELFEAALVKLGNLGSSSHDGNIRKVCSVLNPGRL